MLAMTLGDMMSKHKANMKVVKAKVRVNANAKALQRERDVRQASKESSPAGSGDEDANEEKNRHDYEAWLDRDLVSRALVYDEKHLTFFSAVLRSQQPTNKQLNGESDKTAAAEFLRR